MKNLTSKPDDMNEADAVLIADVIENIVSLDDSLNEVLQDAPCEQSPFFFANKLKCRGEVTVAFRFR